MLLRAALVLGYVICRMPHASGIEKDGERRSIFEIAAGFLQTMERYKEQGGSLHVYCFNYRADWSSSAFGARELLLVEARLVLGDNESFL